MKSILLVLILMVAGLMSTHAQDKIIKKDGKVLEVKVIEVGSADVKYRFSNDDTGPIYTLEKSQIQKIIYQNGREESFKQDLKNPELYADQTKNALKLNFIAPLLGYTQINFEHNMRPGKSYELALGLIGLGKREHTTLLYDRKPLGAYFGAGYKYSKLPDFINRTERYSHVLQGQYVKTELIFGVYGQDIQNTNGDFYRKSTVFGGFMLNLGKQWVLGEEFLIDTYLGIGYALDNLKEDEENGFTSNHFALAANGNSGLGLTAGLKVGMLLHKKRR